MNGPEFQKPDPAIHTFKDDAGRLVETYQRQIILGSILTLVLGMWAISHGCDQSKQAQIEKQQLNAKKYNTAPGLPQASTINGQKCEWRSKKIPMGRSKGEPVVVLRRRRPCLLVSCNLTALVTTASFVLLSLAFL